uniref:Lectin n=1 Tax=Lygus hesperus TaxID=30085 RepID=A0A146L3I5_LYGHE
MSTMKEAVFFHLIILGIAGANVINRGDIRTTEFVTNINVSAVDVFKGLISLEEHTKTFDIIRSGLTWSAAVVYCKERHGDLASIRSQEENDLIGKMMNYSGLGAGLVHIGGTSARSLRGYFWISDGEPLTYQNWMPGQPSGANKECIAYQRLPASDWKWILMSCNDLRPFACEYYAKSNVLK